MIPREPVLNAMRRPAMVLGTHIGAVMGNLIFCMYAFMFTDNLWALALAIPIHGVSWLITQTDPFAFRILGLYAGLRIETLPNRFLWGCASRDPNKASRNGGPR